MTDGLRHSIEVDLFVWEKEVTRAQPLRAFFVPSADMVLKLLAANCHPHTRKKDFGTIIKKKKTLLLSTQPGYISCQQHVGNKEKEQRPRKGRRFLPIAEFCIGTDILTSASRGFLPSDDVPQASEARLQLPAQELRPLGSCVSRNQRHSDDCRASQWFRRGGQVDRGVAAVFLGPMKIS